MPGTAQPAERGSAGLFRPQLVLAREPFGGKGTDKATRARVLIVEDEYLVALQMETELTNAGFEIVGIASSADEASALAAAHLPALAIMDIRLRGPRDGVEAALELFAKHGIRSLFVTAHYDPDTRRRAQPAEPIGWLPKPYSMPLLIAQVRAALAKIRDDEA
ncbi:MAG: response regulator [Methylobacteriaceae bacterium]|nr:response regulator [Methylobacteriaceae bacterium]MBV9247571.1 response regulator [Methylobacteriaceae bacterium]